MKPLQIAFAAVLLAACAQPSESTRTDAPPAAAPTGASATPGASEGARSPLKATLDVVSSEPGTAVIYARIQKLSPIEAPILVELEVPPGVSVEGPTTFEIGAFGEAKSFEQKYLVTYSKLPAGDLVLVARMKGPGFGVRATDKWSFGRPEEPTSTPRANGPAPSLPGFKPGPSVPVE